MKEKCGNCRWWENNYDGQESPKPPSTGWCHRYPPAVITYHTDGDDTVWPTTNVDDFCGEFQSKEK